MAHRNESKLLVNKINQVAKALELSQLKNLALETMIEVTESDLHIKIRKKGNITQKRQVKSGLDSF